MASLDITEVTTTSVKLTYVIVENSYQDYFQVEFKTQSTGFIRTPTDPTGKKQFKLIFGLVSQSLLMTSLSTRDSGGDIALHMCVCLYVCPSVTLLVFVKKNIFLL